MKQTASGSCEIADTFVFVRRTRYRVGCRQQKKQRSLIVGGRCASGRVAPHYRSTIVNGDPATPTRAPSPQLIIERCKLFVAPVDPVFEPVASITADPPDAC